MGVVRTHSTHLGWYLLEVGLTCPKKNHPTLPGHNKHVHKKMPEKKNKTLLNQFLIHHPSSGGGGGEKQGLGKVGL